MLSLEELRERDGVSRKAEMHKIMAYAHRPESVRDTQLAVACFLC